MEDKIIQSNKGYQFAEIIDNIIENQLLKEGGITEDNYQKWQTFARTISTTCEIISNASAEFRKGTKSDFIRLIDINIQLEKNDGS